MPVFKTTQAIFNSPWGEELDDHSPANVKNMPHRTEWDNTDAITICDVKLWEQIYFKSGHLGIYAAWNPYADYYIIVHNLFINTTFGIEEFKGLEAVNDVWERAKELGVTLTPS